jgi:hypothetical protein
MGAKLKGFTYKGFLNFWDWRSGMINNTIKSLDFYLAMKCPFTIHQDDAGGFVAEIVDLSGCITQAETLDELISSVDKAKRA